MARARRIVVFAGLGAVALLVGGVGITLSDAGAFRTLTPHGFEQCARLEGVLGSEDLVFDAVTGLVFISTQDFRSMEHASPKPGAILAWDPSKGGAPRPLAHDLKGELHPHGLGLLRLEDNARRLFVVNHPTRATSTVELFDVVEGPALTHVRTIEAPEFVSMNDVAPVGPEAFYVTLDAGTRAGTFGRLIETFLARPWAGVGYFDGKSAHVVVKDLRYANGVAVTTDRATVFVSESSGHRLMAFSRDVATGALTLLASHRDESGLDNLSFAADGSVWIGTHPNLLAFLGHASNPVKRSPSQVLRATFDAQARRFTVTDVALDDGARLSGSSVALPLGEGRVLVGSVFEHVLDCRFAP